MGKLDCVEPAYVQGSRQFVQHAQAGDQLYFPHVDSCMAIVWILDDGSAVGGHVPVVWSQSDDFDYPGNANRVRLQMSAAIGGMTARIVKLATLGDANWENAVSTLRTNSGSPPHLYLYKDLDGGVDLYVDVDNQTIEGFDSKFQGSKLCHAPFAAITGADPIRKYLTLGKCIDLDAPMVVLAPVAAVVKQHGLWCRFKQWITQTPKP